MVFDKELKILPNNFVIMINSSKNLHNYSYDILKQIQGDGVCITLNKPAYYLKEDLENKGIRTDNFHFVDCIANLLDEKNLVMNCSYLDLPYELAELDQAVNNAIKSIKGKDKFLILDSFSDLLMYYPTDTVVNFLNSLISKLRSAGIKTVILANEEALRENVRKKLFCDRIYSLE